MTNSPNQTPDALRVHLITPSDPPQMPCWLFNKTDREWYHFDNTYPFPEHVLKYYSHWSENTHLAPPLTPDDVNRMRLVCDFARQLETELASARAELAEAKAKLSKLDRFVPAVAKSQRDGWATANELKKENDALRAQVEELKAALEKRNQP